MSEPKAYRIIQGDTGGCGAPSYKCDTNANRIEEWSDACEVYDKFEADKVIAELKQKINEVHTELELWRDGSIISEEHQKELDEKRHSDYKRCLAMANYWVAVSYRCVDGMHRQRSERHHRKWLELAEKFKDKEAK